MAATTEINYDEQLRETVGSDATANFESSANFVESNPTETASNESLYAAAGLNAAGKTAPALDEEDEDEDEDDDLEDDDDDLDDEDDEDDEDEDEDEDLEDDEEDEDEDDEEEDDEDDEDEDDDDDEEEDEDTTLKMDSSDSIRGRATGAAKAVARRR